MSMAIYPALFFTVAMLVNTAYFIMGGLPLLVLKHDTPQDARFIHGFFNIYYKVAIATAAGAGASYALWGRFAFAAGAMALIFVAALLRRRFLGSMRHLGARIQLNQSDAIAGFRKVHVQALGVNFAQLVLLVWGTTRLSL